MRTELISIGTELLMGDVVDTNSGTIAQELLKIGIGTYNRQVVGDNPDRLEEALSIADKRSDIIILSGGLGPTEDDITKEVTAKFVQDELIEDSEQLDKITNYYQGRDQHLPDNMYRQSYTLKNGRTFFNEVGLACGTAFERKRENGSKQYVILLPGPPFEMEHMLVNYLLPYLKDTLQSDEVIESLYLNLYGVGESRTAELLEETIDNQSNPTIAIYARPRHVFIRLTANASDSETAEKLNQTLADKILEKVGQYFIGYGENQTIESFVVHQLKEKNVTMSVVEGITGGLVMESLTSISGVSSTFSGGLIVGEDQDYSSFFKELDGRETSGKNLAKALAEQSLNTFKTDSVLSVTGEIEYESDREEQGTGTLYLGFARRNHETKVRTYPLTNRPKEILRTIAKNEAFAFVRECLN